LKVGSEQIERDILFFCYPRTGQIRCWMCRSVGCGLWLKLVTNLYFRGWIRWSYQSGGIVQIETKLFHYEMKWDQISDFQIQTPKIQWFWRRTID
jgi:hypothetical protein